MVLARHTLLCSAQDCRESVEIGSLLWMALAVSAACAIAVFVALALLEPVPRRSEPVRQDILPGGPQEGLRSTTAEAERGMLLSTSIPSAVEPVDTSRINEAKPETRKFVLFSLTRSRRFQHLGPVGVQVRRIDSRRGFYDLALLVNGRRLNKRHVKVNEIVTLAKSDSGIASELVVSQIERDRISGYISESRDTQPPASTP